MDELVERLSRFKMGTRRSETIDGKVPNREVQVDREVPVDRKMPADGQVQDNGQIPIDGQPIDRQLPVDRRVPVQRPPAQQDEEELNIATFKLSIKCQILSDQIISVFDYFKQSNKLYLTKRELRQFLYDAFKSQLKNFDLFVVGSTLNGFGSRHSELDLCLLKPVSDDDQAAFLMVIGFLNVNSTFRENFEYQLYSGDRPFKLSLQSDRLRVVTNLAVNKPLYIRNTQLIRCYSRIDGRVQRLASVIRAWAEANEIDELSNYNLVLMLIHYLQVVCLPAVLPVLQRSLPDHFQVDSDVKRLEIDVPLPEFRTKNMQPLGELLIGLLDYYGNRFDYIHSVVSIRNEQALVRREDVVKERKTLLADGRLPAGQTTNFDIQKSALDLVYIEDPIDLSNTASSITSHEALASVILKFRRSYAKLKESNDLCSIVDFRKLLGIS